VSGPDGVDGLLADLPARQEELNRVSTQAPGLTSLNSFLNSRTSAGLRLQGFTPPVKGGTLRCELPVLLASDCELPRLVTVPGLLAPLELLCVKGQRMAAAQP
jgi:hypothetical protein